MKIECIKKTIDLDKIYWAIDCFKAKHNGERPSYIIMSYETKAELVDKYYFETVIKNLSNILEIETLFGIPVAFNEGLKIGEVEIV
jgi:hypothetical protein